MFLYNKLIKSRSNKSINKYIFYIKNNKNK